MLRRSICLATVLALLVSGVSVVSAKEVAPAETGTGGALLDALAHVPFTTAARESMVSYLDQAALVAARPGATPFSSVADALAGLEADDPAADLWLAAYMGASSGDPDLLRGLLSGAADWPEKIGFDLLDVERHLTFGTPPSDGTLLIGAIDPAAVTAAYEARGYGASTAAGRTRLCGAAGCEAGLQVDLAHADPSLPFGGHIGRSDPLSVSERDLLVSADSATLEAMESATLGEMTSLAEDPAYRGLALAADPDVTLVQATILPGAMLGLGPDIYRILAGTPEAATELLDALAQDFEPMPPAEAVAVMDGATDTEQVVTIALAYQDEADAAVAAAVLPRRLADPGLAAASYGTSVAALLADRGVTGVAGSVVAGDSGRLPVARVEVRAPLPGEAVDASTGGPVPSSALYRLFLDLLNRRDMLWLVPVLPLE
jgi:hypothetical protein